MKRFLLSTALAAALSAGFGGAALADPLVDAVEAGDSAAAMRLIGEGADVRATSPDGTTALHWAVYNSDAELVSRLLREGADVSAVNHYSSTPMMEAAVFGDVAIMAMLLEAGADVESPNADGQTALMVVARTENLDAARLLLAHGADVNAVEQWRGQTPVMWAAAQNRAGMVELLLDSGADPNARSFINEHRRQITAEPRYIWRPISGWTPLLLAAREGCGACVAHLLDAGADIDMGNPENVTPLLIATMNFHFDTARLLVERGANPDKWDWRGRTPLYMAIDLNTLPHGGRADLPSTDATAPLELARLLLEAGANPNLQIKLNPGYRNTKDDRGSDNNLTIGTTALARAAKAFDVAAIRLLAEYDPLVDLPNDSGLTPLMLAAGTGSLERDTRGTFNTPDTQARSIAAIDALLEMGADINNTATNGQSALFGAAGWGWTDVVTHLAQRGAQLDLRDNSGATALDAAMGRISRGLRSAVVVHEETGARLIELMEAQGIEIPADQLASAQ
jgi:ankyrin repeat protein